MKVIKSFKDCENLVKEIKIGRIIKVNELTNILYIGNGNYLYQSIFTPQLDIEDRNEPVKYSSKKIEKIIWRERKTLNAINRKYN